MQTSVRQISSSLLATKMGIAVPAHLPELDGHLSRSESEVVDRLLSLHALAAVAHGLPRKSAIEWIKDEELVASLEAMENQFLYEAIGNQLLFRVQVEAMFALAWALGLYPNLDFWADCDNRFVHRLPNLKVKESSAALRHASHLRSSDEVLAMTDLGYCLNWALRDAQICEKLLPSDPSALVVEQRRRALEWLVGDEDWSETSLDT